MEQQRSKEEILAEPKSPAACAEPKSPAADAESKLPVERAEPAQSFQELIRGKYREDYLQALGEALSAQAREIGRYQAYRELKLQAEALHKSRPEFELERELEDPGFARLIENGVDLETAFEVVHRREKAEREANLARNAARPQENGLGSGSAAVAKADPRLLTRAERRQLRRRAARGEEIVW